MSFVHEKAGGHPVFTEELADAEKKQEDLLKEIRPDAYCKGPEWTAENLPERETLARIGEKLVAVGDPKNHSTTEMLRALRRE